MRVAIVGAGALGTVYGARLAALRRLRRDLRRPYAAGHRR